MAHQRLCYAAALLLALGAGQAAAFTLEYRLMPDAPMPASALSPEGCHQQPGLASGTMVLDPAEGAICHSGAMAVLPADSPMPDGSENEFVSAPLEAAIQVEGLVGVGLDYRNSEYTPDCGSACLTPLHVAVDALLPDGTVLEIVRANDPVDGGYYVDRTNPLNPQIVYFVSYSGAVAERRAVPAASRIRVRMHIEAADRSSGQIHFGGTSYHGEQFHGALGLGGPPADAGDDLDAPEGSLATLDGRGSGVENYTWTQTSGPPVELDDAHSATPNFTAPEVCEPAVLAFELTSEVQAYHNYRETDDVTVTVHNVNALPVANAGADQSIQEGESVQLMGSASVDADHCQSLRYAWTQTAGPPAPLDRPAEASPRFTAPGVSTDTPLTFELTVTDPEGAMSTDTISVLVRDAPVVPPPVVDPSAASGGAMPPGLLLSLALLALRRRRGSPAQPRVRASGSRR